MSPKIMTFSTRRSDLSPEEYREYYENKHVPLMQSLLGDAFPLAFVRNYIGRSNDTSSNYPVHFLMGEGDLDFDCIAESIFQDQEHLDRCMAELGQPEKRELREADEAKFLDMTKLKVVVVDARRDFPAGKDSFVVKAT